MKINKSFKIGIFFLGPAVIITLIFMLRPQGNSYPNVLLITVDALRADHLTCYGYKRKTSPNIDSLAKEGVYFLNCFSASNTTVSASPALLTGKYLEAITPNCTPEYDNTLDNRFTTLAEYLKNFGYNTIAFLNQEYFRIGSGFERGFDAFVKVEEAEDATTHVLNFLNEYHSNKPFFIWVHYLDVHAPYSSPEEYFKIFEGDMLYKEKDKILELNSKDVPFPNSSYGYIPRYAFRKDKYSLNYYIAYYDAGILYTDFYIGGLLKNIKGNTLILLTADHGESLGEHNVYLAHGENLYDEELRIPLIIKDSRDFKGGKSISKIGSSVDIVPTILNRVNPAWHFFNKYRFDGGDLTIFARGKDIKRKYIYSYYASGWSIRSVNKNIKYILQSNGEDELYFEPDESNNLIEGNSLEISSVRGELIDNLEAWLLKNYPIPSDGNSKKINLDEGTKNKIRNLGYLN